ncbi:LysE/ArgO family amino acid transporter [Roseobacter ponti]|uniref:Amino acid transporter n=1 Tax=Roseobacter ponti TaxID=1891787 RepID=A0A858SRK8_9RHOB|nr:LysE/ArgO family amino acid transporter [Roseobacter ponti]QJF50462.1 amino acid transporter [Roseobacter ponti]
MFIAVLSGFLLSLSLIIAIGPQNAFVLRQGLVQRHVFWVCSVCGLCDAILIVAGVYGSGSLARSVPWFEPAMRYGGAAFLIFYGYRSALSAWRGGQALHTQNATSGQGLATTLLTLLAITWLNPHVYLDTVVLIGSVSAQFPDRAMFGAGAVIGSFSFFFALGYGARLLAPLFARPRSWQVLDAVIALTMWTIALGLLIS